MALSSEYLAAIEAHNTALRVYQVACDAYHALKIGDAEFIAAKEIKLAADAAFDAAFAAEENREAR